MLSHDLLVAHLWEGSNVRGSESALPLLGPSPLKPMPVDAQCVGTGLRAFVIYLVFVVVLIFVPQVSALLPMQNLAF